MRERMLLSGTGPATARHLPVLVVAAMVLASACDPARPTMIGEVRVVPAEVFLGVGDTVTLRLQAADGTPILEPVVWSVDDPSVAEISSRGLLSAVGIGTTSAHGSSGGAVGTASVTVGPFMAGSWYGQSDTVLLYLRISASASPDAFTGLGSLRLGAQPDIYVTASGTHYRDSVWFTGAGGDLGFDYAGEVTGVDEVSGTLRLDQAQQLALIMRRINP